MLHIMRSISLGFFLSEEYCLGFFWLFSHSGLEGFEVYLEAKLWSR